jgi:multidrug efflux pump subunit AcrB
MEALISTLAISCVLTTVVFRGGPAKYLFTPLGLAVVFAMVASYGLLRTLTPITIGLLLKGESRGDERGMVRAFPRLPRGWQQETRGTAAARYTLAARD